MHPSFPSLRPHRLGAWLAAALLAGAAMPASADGLQSLEAFARATQSGRASFTQQVTPPAQKGQPARTKTASGSFAFQRPGRFLFDYQKPFVQTIVADGRTLWLYDADLNQVTARAQADALGSTPAALVASAADLKALEKDFSLKSEPEKDGLQWVLATPKARDGQLKSVRVGLQDKPGAAPELVALDILDSFGQRSQIRFTHFEVNPKLPASTFEFKPPAGADVLKQ